MADLPVTPEITRTDILTASQRKVESSTIDAAVGTKPSAELKKIKDSAALAEAMRQNKESNPSNLQAELGRAAAPEIFTGELNEFKAVLGDNPRVQEALDRLDPLKKYVDVARQSEASGQSIEATAGTDWDAMRKAVVETLLTRGQLLDKFPEIALITDVDARIKFVEEVVARDPRLHHELSKELNALLADAKEKIKPDPQAEELEQRERTKKVVEDRQNAQLAVVEAALTREGIDAAQIQKIKDGIGVGIPPKNTLLDIEGYLVQQKGLGNEYYALRDYSNKLSSIEAHQTQIDAYQSEFDQLNSVTKNRNQQRLNELTAALTRLKTDLPRVRGQANAIKDTITATGMTDAEFDQKRRAFDAIRGMTGEDSALAVYLSDLQTNGELLRTTDQQINAIRSNPENSQRIAQREKDREDILRKLENLPANATARFLDQRYRDYVSDQDLLMRVAAKEAEGRGDIRYADDVKKLSSHLNKLSWYNESTGKWNQNRDEIGPALRSFVAEGAKGNPGERRIIAEATGYNLNAEEQRNAVVNELFGNRKKYDSLTPDEKMRADQEIQKRDENFEKLVTDQGPKVKERLINAYVASRGLKDRFGLSGALSLTADQLKIIEDQAGGLIDVALSKSKEGSKTLAELKAKGIVPDFKLKWLLFLLLGAGVAIPGIGLGLGAAALASR